MTRVEQILFDQEKKFALMIGKTEQESIEAGHRKIASIRAMSLQQSIESLIDITTGKKHKSNY
jgi:hypothetical protein